MSVFSIFSNTYFFEFVFLFICTVVPVSVQVYATITQDPFSYPRYTGIITMTRHCVIGMILARHCVIGKNHSGSSPSASLLWVRELVIRDLLSI